MEKIIENNKIVGIEEIKANDYNPKLSYKDSPELMIEFDKLKKSLEYHGQIDPLLVREVKSGYELVNGYHRLEAMKELKWKRVEIKDLGKISRIEAIKKALSTEELRIPLDVIEVAELIKGIKDSEGSLEGLPYLEEEIENKIKLLNFDWSKYESDFLDVIEDDVKKLRGKRERTDYILF